VRLCESFFVLRLAWQNLVFEFVRSGFGEDHWDSDFDFHDYILSIQGLKVKQKKDESQFAKA
tara:strand:- start:1276 stop:1461 length:186 start_codon:yes stop_codon:yes gene_type:complete